MLLFAKSHNNKNPCSESYPGVRLGCHDVTVTHLDDAAASGGSFGIMSDHDDRLVKAAIQFLKHVQDDRGVF